MGIYQHKLQPNLADTSLWLFDQSHFKEAITFLLLADKKERGRNDMQMKKLISSKFVNPLAMRLWTIDLFDEVSWFESSSLFISYSGVYEIDKTCVKATNFYVNSK